jgi:hypothetical protein
MQEELLMSISIHQVAAAEPLLVGCSCLVCCDCPITSQLLLLLLLLLLLEIELG